MRRLAGLFLVALAASAAAEQRFAFESKTEGVVVAELEMRSPGADWMVEGREASVAVLRTDGGNPHHVILYGGEVSTPYRVFLGSLGAGKHTLTVARDDAHSAAGTGLEVKAVRFETFGKYDPVAAAPVLYIRKNTVGKFSDVPTIVYCEKLQSEKGPYFQYTAIFSNEDGGTTSRGLMARWGRTTDIEYMYRVYLDDRGKPGPAIIQGPNHVDTEWTGQMDGLHPLLMPVTNNNTFGPADPASPLRFQIAPIVVDLTTASRESVMDRYPVTWTVMAKELVREKKLREFGVVEGEKISDPRNYLYVDYSTASQGGVMSVLVRLRDGREFASDLGQLTFGIERTGNVRTAVELPPKTRRSDIAALGFRCRPKNADSKGRCEVRGVSSAFLLNEDGRPGEALRPNVARTGIEAGDVFWSLL